VRVCGSKTERECVCASVRVYKRARERESENVGRFIVREVPNSTETLETIVQRCESKGISFSLTCTHNDDDCFYDHSWRNNAIIVFGPLSSFLTYLHIVSSVD